VLIIVIAVFAIVMALAAVWGKRMVADYRRQRRVEQRTQAEWLAEAGVRRAAARLTIDPEYHGETWTISAQELNQQAGAAVEISVEPLAASVAAPETTANANTPANKTHRLIARARYPAPNPRVQSTKIIEYTPTPSEPAS
jgi:type II secretory pathway component PulK